MSLHAFLTVKDTVFHSIVPRTCIRRQKVFCEMDKIVQEVNPTPYSSPHHMSLNLSYVYFSNAEIRLANLESTHPILQTKHCSFYLGHTHHPLLSYRKRLDTA
jgi:hypothetical protein